MGEGEMRWITCCRGWYRISKPFRLECGRRGYLRTRRHSRPNCSRSTSEIDGVIYFISLLRACFQMLWGWLKPEMVNHLETDEFRLHLQSIIRLIRGEMVLPGSSSNWSSKSDCAHPKKKQTTSNQELDETTKAETAKRRNKADREWE